MKKWGEMAVAAALLVAGCAPMTKEAVLDESVKPLEGRSPENVRADSDRCMALGTKFAQQRPEAASGRKKMGYQSCMLWLGYELRYEELSLSKPRRTDDALRPDDIAVIASDWLACWQEAHAQSGTTATFGACMTKRGYRVRPWNEAGR